MLYIWFTLLFDISRCYKPLNYWVYSLQVNVLAGHCVTLILEWHTLI